MKNIFALMCIFISNFCLAHVVNPSSDTTGFFYNSIYADRIRNYASNEQTNVARKLLCNNKSETECLNILKVKYNIFALNGNAKIDGYYDWLERKAKVDGALLEHCMRSVTAKYLTLSDDALTDKVVSFCEKEVKAFTSDLFYSSTTPDFISKYLTDTLSVEQMKKFIGGEIWIRNIRRKAKYKNIK